MKKLFFLTMFIILICLFSSCASVKFYSRADLSEQTGLKYYTVKPYILVEFNSGKDNAVKTTVVYLPDLANPQYIVLKPGIGSNELKMAFTNSSLNSWGLISESQIPEAINAITALLSKSVGIIGQFAQADNTMKQSSSDLNFKLYEIVISVDGTILKEVIIGEKRTKL